MLGAAGQVRQWWVRTRRRQFITRFYSRHLPSLVGAILDVGGGRAAPHDRWWGPGLQRVRVDLSLRHRPDVGADVRRLPVRSSSLDAVVASELLEHLPDPGEAVRELHRVLRPGGVLLGSVPFVFPLHGDPSDYYRYTEHGLRHLLAPFSGCEIEAHGNAVGGAWTLLAARSRTVRALNPLFRYVFQGVDRACPEGYAFRAVK